MRRVRAPRVYRDRMAQVTECPPGPHSHDSVPYGGSVRDGGAAHAGVPRHYQQGQYVPPPKDRFTQVTERLWTHPAWLAPLLMLGCFAGVSALFLANDPTDGKPDPFGGCLVKALTGFDCPGCGGTRAFWYLMHGNLPEAARHHLFAVFAAPFVVYLYVAWAARRIFDVQLPAFRVTPRMIGYFMAAWGVFMVLRNLPWAPFTMLYV